MEIRIYDSKKEVARYFSEYLKALIVSKNEVHIALSGGSTPKIVFEELSDTVKYKIDWSKVHFYWGDERCVSPTDEESNYKMTNTHLLSNIDIPAQNVHRIFGENQPAKEAMRYAKLLKQNLPSAAGIPAFDLVILGMGDDGHTASIFPDEINLWDSENFCEVATHPVSGQKRITITGTLINNAHEVAFLVTGNDKKEKVTEIIHKTGNFKTYPAFLVTPGSGNLIWFLDKDASSEL